MFCKSFLTYIKKSTYKVYSTDVEKDEQELILANTIFYFKTIKALREKDCNYSYLHSSFRAYCTVH